MGMRKKGQVIRTCPFLLGNVTTQRAGLDLGP